MVLMKMLTKLKANYLLETFFSVKFSVKNIKEFELLKICLVTKQVKL